MTGTRGSPVWAKIRSEGEAMPTLATLIIREFYEHAAVSRDHTSALARS